MTLAMLQAALLIGVGATVIMDLWGILLRRLGIPTLNFAMVGRWAGHLMKGRARHEAIAKAEPVANEVAWGWLIHYGIGVLFAVMLVGMVGEGWLGAPTLWPALAWGVVTVAALDLVGDIALPADACQRQRALKPGMFLRFSSRFPDAL